MLPKSVLWWTENTFKKHFDKGFRKLYKKQDIKTRTAAETSLATHAANT